MGLISDEPEATPGPSASSARTIRSRNPPARQAVAAREQGKPTLPAFAPASFFIMIADSEPEAGQPLGSASQLGQRGKLARELGVFEAGSFPISVEGGTGGRASEASSRGANGNWRVHLRVMRRSSEGPLLVLYCTLA